VDDIGAEAVLPEYQRHTGARGFALSSAIDVDVFVLGEGFEFFVELVGFDTDGACDAGGAGVVVSVAADVDEDDFVGEEAVSQFRDFDAGDDAGDAVAAEFDDAIDDEGDEGGEYNFSEGVTGALQSASDFDYEIAKDEAQAGVRENIERSAEEIQTKELCGFHFHAAGEGWGHAVYAGNEFGEDEGGAAAFVKRLGGTEDAGFGIQRKAAEEAEERPSSVTAEDEEEEVTEHHGADGGGEDGGRVEEMGGGSGSGGDKGESGGSGKAGGFGEHDEENQ